MKLIIAILTTLFVSSATATSVSIMTYNAENLFDTTHDEGKKDYTWLPLKVKQRSKEIQKYCASMRSEHYRRNCFELDWSEETLDAKIENLSKPPHERNNTNQGRKSQTAEGMEGLVSDPKYRGMDY